MSAIDSTDKIRGDIEGLLEDRKVLVALRHLLDAHRKDIYPNATEGPNRAETDEEVIARLAEHRDLTGVLFHDERGRALGVYAGAHDGVQRLVTHNAFNKMHKEAYDKGHAAGMKAAPEHRPTVTDGMVRPFTHFTDEAGRALGQYIGTKTERGLPILQTNDIRGKEYAKGFWNGLSYTEGGDGAVIGTPAYDRNGAKVDSDSWGSGGAQSLHAALERSPTTVTCSTGAEGMTSAPEPIRLRVGQAWRLPGGGEKMVTELGTSPWDESSGSIYPSTGLNTYRIGSHSMRVRGDWTIVDADGCVLIAGPGFTG